MIIKELQNNMKSQFNDSTIDLFTSNIRMIDFEIMQLKIRNCQSINDEADEIVNVIDECQQKLQINTKSFIIDIYNVLSKSIMTKVKYCDV